LKRLSHSNNIVNLLGAQRLLNIDKTATGSVADIRTQNNKQTKNGISNQTNGNKKYNQEAIKLQDINSQKIAREAIDFQL
jgi:hypothetical protein